MMDVDQFALALILICCHQWSTGEITSDPIVTIGQTNIRGRISVTKDGKRPVFAFRSIYYADPPLGSKRFAAPSLRSLPAGHYDATEYGPLCPQDLDLLAKAFYGYPIPSLDPSEDCLHLDVYTPTLDSNSRLAVMVWIHGGAFLNGGTALYDGSALAETQNVIVVVLNYRLGPLGFLSLGDESAPGNFGLLDQQLALKWVQNNIAYFGGDPSRVTIFGESAGGISTSLHLLVPSNRNLFHRVITQSGPAISVIAIVENPSKWAKLLADSVGCVEGSSGTNKAIVNCLRSKPAHELINVKLPKLPDRPIMTFAPVVDGNFLRDHPMNLYQAGLFGVKADLLIGYNNNEGGYAILATRARPGFNFKNFSADAFRTILKNEFSKAIPGDPSSLISHIETVYSGPEGITDQRAFQVLGDVLGDSFFVAPSLAIADFTSESGYYTFLYEFQHRPAYYKGPEFVGADHGVEEPLVLGFPFLVGQGRGTMEFAVEDESLSAILMTYWGNFAKYGDPNGEKFELPYWPPYTHSEKIYMQLRPQPEITGNPKPNKVIFWNRLFSSTRLLKDGRHARPVDEL